jgi:hypothetical protein
MQQTIGVKRIIPAKIKNNLRTSASSRRKVMGKGDSIKTIPVVISQKSIRPNANKI